MNIHDRLEVLRGAIDASDSANPAEQSVHVLAGIVHDIYYELAPIAALKLSLVARQEEVAIE